MAEIVFQGGPCNGQFTTYHEQDVFAGTTSCKGQAYVLYKGDEGNYLGLLPGARPPSQSAYAALPGATTPENVLAAWEYLRNAIGRGVPADVNRTIRLRRAIRQAGRK